MSASQRSAIVIDVSASMGARSGGTSRLDEAKALARGAVAGVGSGREACIIALGREAHRVAAFSGDPRVLAAAIDGLQVDCAASDPAAGLRLLRTLARSEPFARAVLITDAVMPAILDEDLACPLEVVRTAPAGANLGITHLSARRRPDGAWDVAVEVASAAEPSAGAVLRLLGGGRELLSRPVAPAPLAAEQVLVRVDGGPMRLEARLEPRGADALDLDDRAGVVVPASDPARAWVQAGLGRWRQVLSAQPALRLVDAPADGLDLIVSSDPADLARPARIRLGIGVVPRELAGLMRVGADAHGSRTVDARHAHPLLAHLALDDIAWADRAAWTAGMGEREAEAQGWTVVVHGDAGPLLVERARPDGWDWSLTVHTDRSDLPYRLAFPVMGANLALAALQAAGRAEASSLPTGQLPPLRTGPGPVRIEGPDGVREATPDIDGIVAGIAAPAPGFYLVGGRERIDVGTGLLDPVETRLQPVPGVRAREVAVGEGATVPGELPLWPWLVLAAIAALGCEWWLAHRPPRGGGRP